MSVFPKGARFLFVRSPHTIRRRPDKASYHIKGMSMANTVSEFNRSFVIVRSTEQGKWLGAYQIDQFCSPRDGERGHTRIRNQVERHLFHQFRKTGEVHAIVYEGNPEMAAAILAQETACPF